MRQATFPESFSERPHPVGFGARQWVLLNANDEICLSVVNGPHPFFYCGPDTFEMCNFTGQPVGYMTKEDINAYLEEREIMEYDLAEDAINEIKPGGSICHRKQSTSEKSRR